MKTTLALALSVAAFTAACDVTSPSQEPTAVAPRALASIRASETPVAVSATIVGKKRGFNIVSIVWQDTAIDEDGTTAGFSAASGQWLFFTEDASASGYGAGTGTRTVEFYAPKDAASVQLLAHWASGDVTPYSTAVAITK